MKKIAYLLLIISTLAIAKNHEWQDAVVYRVASENSGAAAAPIGNIVLAVPLSRVHYFVETSDLRIELFYPGGRNLNITLDKKTKIAIDGDKAFLVDDVGKVRKLKIILKKSKTPEQSYPPPA